MSIKILIVDDDATVVAAVAEYLAGRGYECESALEAAEAQALLAHLPFDVVLTDIYLSGLNEADGLRVLSFIRERALRVGMIVMTAHATPQLEAEVRRLGAEAVLHKPTPLAHLADALAAVAEARA
jgi:CheY-like chemotaxis protein